MRCTDGVVVLSALSMREFQNDEVLKSATVRAIASMRSCRIQLEHAQLGQRSRATVDPDPLACIAIDRSNVFDIVGSASLIQCTARVNNELLDSEKESKIDENRLRAMRIG